MNNHAHHYVFPLPLHTTPYLTGVCKHCGAESAPHLAVEAAYGDFAPAYGRKIEAKRKPAAKLEGKR